MVNRVELYYDGDFYPSYAVRMNTLADFDTALVWFEQTETSHVLVHTSESTCVEFEGGEEVTSVLTIGEWLVYDVGVAQYPFWVADQKEFDLIYGGKNAD